MLDEEQGRPIQDVDNFGIVGALIGSFVSHGLRPVWHWWKRLLYLAEGGKKWNRLSAHIKRSFAREKKSGNSIAVREAAKKFFFLLVRPIRP